MSAYYFDIYGYNVSEDLLDTVGESLVGIKEPGEVDIELIIEKEGYRIDFQKLSHNKLVLGIAVLETSDHIPIYDEEHNTAKYYYAEQGTIIIDVNLLSNSNMNCYRFTLAHEFAHIILHANLIKNQVMGRGNYESYLSRDFTYNLNGKDLTHSTIEWQANRFAAAMLMPKTVFAKYAKEYDDFNNSIVNFVDDASVLFGVSPKGICMRLRELNICDFSYEAYEAARHSVTIK